MGRGERAKLVPVSPHRTDVRGSAATRALLRAFSPTTGRWRTPTGEAWQPALAVEAVLLAYEGSREISLLNVVEKSFARYRGRRSRFFDDDGWYLNVWLRAYDVTGDPKYLAEARSLFETLTDGWDDHCGGGLWWSADRTYKNAITNELFLLAAARLARQTGLPRYGAWAVRCWQWFDASGMINSDDLVNDGLDGNCRNNGQPTWTYNQGVILGGLVELYRSTGERAFLERARRIANAAMRALVHSGRTEAGQDNETEGHGRHGILREQQDVIGNRDAHAFKGVLAQGLARLYAVDPDAHQNLGAFLVANADALRDRADFGVFWLDGSGPVNTASRLSAALLLNSVDLLELGRVATSSGGSSEFGDTTTVGGGSGAVTGAEGESSTATAPAGWESVGKRPAGGGIRRASWFGERVDPPPVDGIRHEAEGAELRNVGTEAIHRGFTGAGYVAGWHRDGQCVEFTVAGGGTVTLRYAAGAGDAYRSIKVDGEVQAVRVLFTGTGSWRNYSTVSLHLRLNDRARVEVCLDWAAGDRNYLNLDSLTVR